MLSRLQFALIGGGLALALTGALWWHGWTAGQERERAAQDAAYRQTIERVKDADLSYGDASDDLEWLRTRGLRYPDKR